MTAPIILWNSKGKKECDDAGIGIIKTVLPPSVFKRFPYQTIAQQPLTATGRGVPPLSYFCVNALKDHTEQLHVLGSARLHLYKETGRKMLLRLLLPNWGTPSFSFLNVDPRIWAALVQIYENIPSLLSTYPIDLSDPYLPLLQEIPSTPDFALITILDLQHSKHLTDDNIIVLKSLHNLCALDISYTGVSAYAIRVFSRTLDFDEEGEPKGPWGLRVLKMEGCRSVTSIVMDYLEGFPLLCIVDVRKTNCTFTDIKPPFYLASDQELYKQPLQDVFKRLTDQHKDVVSCDRPRILSVRPDLVQGNLQPPFRPSGHNSFIVLPPSEGVLRSGKPTRIQFGNADIMEEQQRRADAEEKRGYREARRKTEARTLCYEDEDETMYNERWPDEYSMSDSEDDSPDDDAGSEEEGRRLHIHLAPPSPEPVSILKNFYRQRPHRSPVRLCAESSRTEMILYRTPVPWAMLQTIQDKAKEEYEKPASRKKESERPGDIQRPGGAVEGIQLKGRSKLKGEVQAWQSSLFKRRKVIVPERELTAVDFDISPPLSPTSTLCELEPFRNGFTANSLDSTLIDRRPTVPITTIPRPRLKLDPREHDRKSRMKKVIEKIPGSTKRSEKPVSLEAAFKAQSRKIRETRIVTESNVVIKAKEPVSKRASLDRTRYNKAKQKLPVSTIEPFDWGRWSSTRSTSSAGK